MNTLESWRQCVHSFYRGALVYKGIRQLAVKKSQRYHFWNTGSRSKGWGVNRGALKYNFSKSTDNPIKMIAVKEEEVFVDLTVFDKNSQNVQFDCLMVMNCYIEEGMLELLTPLAKHVILVDGGANRLYKSSVRDAGNIMSIIGDIDSLEKQSREYYQSKNVKTIQDNDDDTNDFQKAIIYAEKNELKSIVCLGLLGGRVDQEFNNLSNVSKYGALNKDTHMIALGGSSLMYLVKPNMKVSIKIGERCIKKKSGVVCFNRAQVQTSGFKWNFGKKYGLTDLVWGQLVSSSNVILQNEVSIVSSAQIYFMVELSPLAES